MSEKAVEISQRKFLSNALLMKGVPVRKIDHILDVALSANPEWADTETTRTVQEWSEAPAVDVAIPPEILDEIANEARVDTSAE